MSHVTLIVHKLMSGVFRENSTIKLMVFLRIHRITLMYIDVSCVTLMYIHETSHTHIHI